MAGLRRGKPKPSGLDRDLIRKRGERWMTVMVMDDDGNLE